MTSDQEERPTRRVGAFGHQTRDTIRLHREEILPHDGEAVRRDAGDIRRHRVPEARLQADVHFSTAHAC